MAEFAGTYRDCLPSPVCLDPLFLHRETGDEGDLRLTKLVRNPLKGELITALGVNPG